ncbi:M3 family metallopeptidase [Qipengyuania sphaerica]|uniref:M3 family metallopeptidase n=1 Tax=Qipengyuania sphaerica TaxID=2867243 RepID=UPI001C875AF7|nr:M3 family metallopeptidase [Qipengyuania sphaerica]MBX7540681.1 Zn-dependent oligopeptidase [Qipengyuania sphaerica]
MRTTIVAALLATTLHSAPALAAERYSDTFAGPVAADAADADALNQRCDRLITEIERRIADFETSKAPYTVDDTLVAFDEISALSYSTGAEFYSYSQSASTQEKRDAGTACYTRLGEVGTAFGLSRPAYDRLVAIDASGEDAQTRYYLEEIIEGYDASGVGLEEEKRAQVAALQKELTDLGAEFQRNIANGRGSIKALPSELTGLPADWIASHQPGPDGLVEITTDSPDMSPVMSYAQNDALRERLARVYYSRAYPQNSELLGKIFTKRHELAELLGRADYATLMLETRMLDTPEKVIAHMAELDQAAAPAKERDLAELRAALAEIRPGQELTWFNSGIASQHVLKTKYDLDPQEVRQYFTFDNVREGVFDLTEDLFGFEIREWDAPKWHPDVESFEIVDGGTVIGRFYLDSHPREGKYKHANHIAMRRGIAGTTMPVSVLTMNLPKGGYDTGLMEHGQVTTFLHEFGHLIHSILGGNQRWMGLSGIANERDFTEAPSQMLEEWVYDYDTLAKFARNEAGEVIPHALVERMNAARYFGQGTYEAGQLGYSNASLRFHMGAPQDTSAEAISRDYKEYVGTFAATEIPEGTHSEAAFGHLNGYSAGYYTYGWSRVIAADLFSRFKQAGLRDEATARAYRELILGPGGSKPAAELIEDFLGRPVNADAFKETLASGGDE